MLGETIDENRPVFSAHPRVDAKRQRLVGFGSHNMMEVFKLLAVFGVIFIFVKWLLLLCTRRGARVRVSARGRVCVCVCVCEKGWRKTTLVVHPLWHMSDCALLDIDVPGYLLAATIPAFFSRQTTAFFFGGPGTGGYYRQV